MTTSRNVISKVTALAGCLALSACGPVDIHDNTVTFKDFKVSFSADFDVDHVMASQSVPVTVTATNVYLIEPSMTPPAAHVADAGHIRIYLDDVATPPLVITAQVKVSVTIPAATPPGRHKLFCRVHKHDGTPTSAVFSVDVTVVTGSSGAVDMAVSRTD